MKLNSIQSLRAVAALLVVYVHSIDLQMEFGVSKQQGFFYLQNFGAIGVDLFFVISGFIITYVANKYEGIGQGFVFLAKRFRRINPAYYIASIIYLSIELLKITIAGQSSAISTKELINSIIDTTLIVPTVDAFYLYSPIMNISWTLAFEWLFYMLFFTLIISKTKNKPLFCGVLIIALVITGYVFNPSNFRYIFLTNPIMLEFILGIGICWLYLETKKTPTWLPIICVSVGVISYILLIIFGFGGVSQTLNIYTAELSLQRFLLWGMPSAFIVFGCIFLEKKNQLTILWNNKLILLLGNASFSIYLIHLTVFALIRMFYTRWGFFMPADIAIIVQLIIATIISIGFYKLIEKPLTKASKNGSEKKTGVLLTT